DRIPTPKWLTTKFVDTGLDLPGGREGRSSMSLYKREVPKGLVTLGSNVDPVHAAGDMYNVFVAGAGSVAESDKSASPAPSSPAPVEPSRPSKPGMLPAFPGAEGWG